MNAKTKGNHLFTKFLFEALEKRPYETQWQFGYYTEYLTLTKENDMIRVNLSLDPWDEYENGTQTFTSLVTADELAQFLENRLAEEKVANVNGKRINMNRLLEEFTDLLKEEAERRNAEENSKLFAKDLPKLKALMPSSDTITWDNPNDAERFEELYEWEMLLEDIEEELKRPTMKSYHDVLNEIMKDKPKQHIELLNLKES